MTLKNVLDVVVPLAAAATPVVQMLTGASESAQKVLENEFRLMTELLKQVDETGLEKEPLAETARRIGETPTFRKFAGADIVPIRELMDRLGERRPRWGGLTRRQSPEGDILWLCEEHLQEYESRR